MVLNKAFDRDEIYKEFYVELNYSNNLAGAMLNYSHALLEKEYVNTDHFPIVLEVGAGPGIHLKYIKHKYDCYVMTDGNPAFVSIMESKYLDKKIIVQPEDAAKLSFEDNYFDRVISSHVLEHIQQPHIVIREWMRVLKPGGVLSLALPCDPGILWNIGRAMGPRRKAMRLGIPYDFFMALEHINPIQNLIAIIRYFYPYRKEIWWPARVKILNINLFYIVHIRKY